MWIYMFGKFIHDAYAGEWYNGQSEQTPEYIGNKFSMLTGMPRLRQLRVQEGKYLVYIAFFVPRKISFIMQLRGKKVKVTSSL